MMRAVKRVVALLIVAMGIPQLGFSQATPHLQDFFRQSIGLNEDQIAAIRNGHAVAKAVHSRSPDEIFLFGAVHIHASPKLTFVSHDFDRLRTLPSYLAFGVFGNPPQLSDLKDFSFDNDDVKAVERCKPGNCLVQGPATSIEEFHRSINWSALDVDLKVNELLQKSALQLLLAYQHDGNPVFWVYNDKHKPVDVAQQFAYMISYYKELPERLTGVLPVPSLVSERKTRKR